jgi:hypothetical protein
VERADGRLIDYIQQATQGGCMLLRTLGIRGKRLERDDPSAPRFCSLLCVSIRCTRAGGSHSTCWN